MIAVITGDIIDSQSVKSVLWSKPLKAALEQFLDGSNRYEIYRGDSFQLVLNDPKDALLAALYIKACIKSINGLDVRQSIGIGTQKTPLKRKLGESNGEAFTNSGHGFDMIEQTSQTLIFKSSDETYDKELNLMLDLATIGFMNNWTPTSAEMIKFMLVNEGLNQAEIAKRINIAQPAVSARLKRANYSLVVKIIDFFRSRILAYE